MSSATLTEPRREAMQPPPPAGASPPPPGGWALRPGHFFIGATLALTAAAAVVLRGAPPIELTLALFTITGAGLAAFGLYRTLVPFALPPTADAPRLVGGRTRVALERDKALTLRSLKELEFDRAMGKIAEADYAEMRARLRARAVRLMQQLEGGASYRDMIERDLRERPAPADTAASSASTAPTCAQCGTSIEADARFCRMCGHALRAVIGR